ncbi:hypothetical protein E4U54_002043 [Claviceps lovelessii]|nr:hypothetical protein E4U54_002043 [Claviceps lovelessii]
MVSKTYTARELIRMRQASVSQDLYNKLFDKLHKDGDLGEIFRMPPERALPLIEEETLGHDEEEEITLKESTVRQLDGTDAEWKYRGRSDLEHGQHEPIGAPPGLSAQRDEGFQRFYKAVVSPTHVRVTAGGRIVPNTRGSSSPTAKWPREKPGVERSFTSRSSSHGTYGEATGIPLTATMPHPAYGPYPHLFPGMFPSMHPSLTAGSHPPPLAMMPWQMGMNMGNTLGLVHSNLTQMHQARSSPNASTERTKSEKQGEGGNSDSPNPVRVSPPEHFDHSRPFCFNGQWMMPPAGSFYPYGMASVPSFPLSGMSPPTVMPPRFAMPAMMQPAAVKSGQKLHAHLASSSSTPSIPMRSPVPVSSIRPSDITKKQIEVLRSSLKYFEDQLQYNKHQIDEKGMETQARMVRQHIQQFEKNLQAQLESEQPHYSKYEHQTDASGSTPDDNGKNSSCTTANDMKSERDSSQSSVSQNAPVHGQSERTNKGQESFLSRRSSALKQVKSASAPVSTKITPESSEDSEPMKRCSTLPAGAALAPPFRPRADSTVSVPLPATFSISSTTYTEENEAVSPVAEQGADSLAEPEAFTEKPYLIGHLPSGRHMEAGNTNSYTYGRELTEDELRARHMYWGKAPHHLQKGLPKFDGKDFYPPSPVKSQPLVSSPTASKHVPIAMIPTGNTEPDYDLATSNADLDPFRSIAKSGQLPLRGSLGITSPSKHAVGAELPTDSLAHTQERLVVGPAPIDQGYSEFRKALSQHTASSTDGCKDKSSDDGEDGSNILFRGRKYMTASGSKSRHDVWQRVWKRNKTSATAVPGTVSSMTARGVLPNYAGHATASLTPAIAGASISPKVPLSKLSISDDLNTTGRVSDKKADRLPAIHGAKENKMRVADK